MITDSIRDYVFSLNNIDECKELTINKIDIDGSILNVDFNDLNNFPNLENLSICNMTIGEDDLIVLESFKNIKILKLYNCDLSNNVLSTAFNNFEIKDLYLDNTEIDFNLINRTFNKVTVRDIKNIYNIKCNDLDISKSNNVDFSKLNITDYNKIIISEKQYLEQKQLFDINNGKVEIEIKKDAYDEVGD